MSENLHTRMRTEGILKINLELMQENEKLKGDRAKLYKDSMTLIEYNEILLKAKDNLEKDVKDIRMKFETIVASLAGKGAFGEIKENGETHE